MWLFVDHPCKFQIFSNLLQEISRKLPPRSQFHIFKTIVWIFLLEQSDLEGCFGYMSSELELYIAAKLLTNFKHLKGVSTLLLILEKKTTYHKISKERIIAVTSVVKLDNLSSNLRIIILRLITYLIFKYMSP